MMAPSVFQRPKSPQTPTTPTHKIQEGAGGGAAVPRFMLQPAAADSTSASPARSSSASDADGESFEGFGEAADPDPDLNAEVAGGGAGGTRSPNNAAINRHSWTRTSLRRTPPSHQEGAQHRRWGSMRHSGKRQLGSNVLASQLYRSSSFNSSGCGSAGDERERDMYSDVSLEEDVQGLNYKVQLLQQQVSTLADGAGAADGRAARARADNAVLQARVHMLEEAVREAEARAEARAADEQRRARDALTRLERDRDQQVDALTQRLQGLEKENGDLVHEVGRVRGVAEALRSGSEAEARRSRELHEHNADLALQLQQARDQERKYRECSESSGVLIAALQTELARLREAAPASPAPAHSHPDLLRVDELHQELSTLRQENKSLREAHEELQAQILSRGVAEGRSLLAPTGGAPALAHNTLAHELQEMTHDQSGASEYSGTTRPEAEQIQKALKEQQDVNIQLRNYIDGILLAIVENYPQLLEVKHKQLNNSPTVK